jgi:hypothetical protein
MAPAHRGGQDGDVADLESIARELCSLDPDRFTAARNARAKEIGGDDGKAVRAMPKPSAAAWATNLLAREHGDELAQLAEIGEALRQAQADVDREALGELGTQRRAVVAALARQAGSLASDRGHPISAAARSDIERTLLAAMTDADAAAAVASARLARALTSDGLEPADLDGAVVGPPPAPVLPRARVTPIAAAPSKRALAAANKALEEARRGDEAADAALRTAERSARSAARERESLLAERDELKQRLADIDAEIADAGRRRSAAEKEAVSAKRSASQAAAALERAEAELKKLLGPAG